MQDAPHEAHDQAPDGVTSAAYDGVAFSGTSSRNTSVSLPGKEEAREEVRAVNRPKGRHAKVHEDKETARQVSEILNSIARLIRAVGVLVDALGRWIN